MDALNFLLAKSASISLRGQFGSKETLRIRQSQIFLKNAEANEYSLPMFHKTFIINKRAGNRLINRQSSERTLLLFFIDRKRA